MFLWFDLTMVVPCLMGVTPHHLRMIGDYAPTLSSLADTSNKTASTYQETFQRFEPGLPYSQFHHSAPVAYIKPCAAKSTLNAIGLCMDRLPAHTVSAGKRIAS